MESRVDFLENLLHGVPTARRSHGTSLTTAEAAISRSTFKIKSVNNQPRSSIRGKSGDRVLRRRARGTKWKRNGVEVTMSASRHCPRGLYNNFASQQNSSNCSEAWLLPARGKPRSSIGCRWKRPEAAVEAEAMGSRTKRQRYLSIARHPVLSTLCDRSSLFYWWNDEIVLSAATSRTFRLPIPYPLSSSLFLPIFIPSLHYPRSLHRYFSTISRSFLLNLTLTFCLDLLSRPRSRQDEIWKRTSTRYLSECVRERSWEIANWIF